MEERAAGVATFTVELATAEWRRRDGRRNGCARAHLDRRGVVGGTQSRALGERARQPVRLIFGRRATHQHWVALLFEIVRCHASQNPEVQ